MPTSRCKDEHNIVHSQAIIAARYQMLNNFEWNCATTRHAALWTGDVREIMFRTCMQDAIEHMCIPLHNHGMGNSTAVEAIVLEALQDQLTSSKTMHYVVVWQNLSQNTKTQGEEIRLQNVHSRAPHTTVKPTPTLSSEYKFLVLWENSSADIRNVKNAFVFISRLAHKYCLNSSDRNRSGWTRKHWDPFSNQVTTSK